MVKSIMEYFKVALSQSLRKGLRITEIRPEIDGEYYYLVDDYGTPITYQQLLEHDDTKLKQNVDGIINGYYNLIYRNPTGEVFCGYFDQPRRAE